jgi:hypothetical protein
MTPDRYLDREQLRPVIGDLISYEGTLYKVQAVGLKYLKCSLASNPKIEGILKRVHCQKWFPPEPCEEYRSLDLVPKK